MPFPNGTGAPKRSLDRRCGGYLGLTLNLHGRSEIGTVADRGGSSE
jgi:hypothetical protein